jgi:peptidoglycan/LPS O-acetylase OafA/YrhL
VVAVILDHLFSWPSGGFVGVDVFFVISGFLITGILLREYDTTGQISFTAFYARRIRRILPAATVVLAATAAIAAAVFAGSKAQSIAFDAVAAFLFASNWRSAITGTDYFQLGSPPSPLQHFWSLSVEEQFYFVWPFLMLVTLVVATRFTRGSRKLAVPRIVVGVLMSAVIVASFVWAMSESANNPTVAYFSTFSRTWELGIGALLAIGARVFVGFPGWSRTLMAYVGLAGIGLSLFAITSETVFPAPGALLPVLSATLVLASGIGTEPRRNWLLTNPVSRYLGDISYSLYLWHLPVITFLAVFIPSTSRVYFVGAAALTLALAAITYRLIEQPLTHAPFISRFPTRASRSAAFSAWRSRFTRQILTATAALAVVSLVTIAGVSAYVSVKGAPAAAVSTEEVVELDPSLSEDEIRIAYDIADAINATEWPTLKPSVEEVASTAPLEDKAGCSSTHIQDPDSCAFGDPSNPSIVVFGDSTAITLLATVRESYGDEYFVRGLTLAGCPSIDLSVVIKTADRSVECLQHRDDSIALIKELRPEMVFISTNYEWSNSANLTSNAQGDAAIEEWAAAAKSTADRISRYTGDVIFVTPPPQGEAIADCATAVSKPADCRSTIPPSWRAAFAAEASIVQGKVHLLDTVDWFCGQSGRCPIFAADTPLKRDGIHTARDWALRIAPVFHEHAEELRNG